MIMEMYSMKTRPTIQCTKSDKNGKYHADEFDFSEVRARV